MKIISVMIILSYLSAVDVTFSVDVSNEDTHPGCNPTLVGSFNNWSSTYNLTEISYGIWETTVDLNPNSYYEFKFGICGWQIENLCPGGACTVTNDGYTNRFLNTPDEDLALETYYYASCEISTGNESGEDWVLVWSDEFDGNGAINSTNWFHQTQLPMGGGWYNGEVQHYTDRIDNSYVSNGTLKIVAKKETYTDQGHTKEYTSARLNSKYAFTYGKVEIRAKLPQGFGTWPAIWMLGKNINESGAYWETQGYGSTSWPACGEVDIMEHWGSNPNYVSSAIHTPSSYGGTVNLGGQYISTASSQFHIYTIDWSAQEMIFSVDGNVHYTYDPCSKNSDTWPFDSELYLLLNIAIEPSIASSFTESSMEIDYVRVYEAYSELSIVDKLIPLQYSINNIYPNPFNPSTTISFSIPKFEHTIIKAYDITGKKLETLTNEVLSIGNYSINWNASSYPSGVYLIRMESGVFTQTQKVVLVK